MSEKSANNSLGKIHKTLDEVRKTLASKPTMDSLVAIYVAVVFGTIIGVLAILNWNF